jgi:hypothetical protein
VAVFTLVMLVVLIGFASLTIDVGYLYNVRAELQNTVDAAALAGGSQLPDRTVAAETAARFSALNYPGAASTVRLGHWDAGHGVFTEGSAVGPINAVEVLAERSRTRGNALTFFFAGIFGVQETNVSASAVSLHGADCLNRGLIAGRLVNINEFEFENVNGEFCVYGRDGVAVRELELENASATFGALDEATISFGTQEITNGTATKVEADIQPTRAQRVGELIDGVEDGTMLESGMTVVVLSGPVTFGRSSGQVVPQPNTAYVVNGDATFSDQFTGENLMVAVRGTLTFQAGVTLHKTAPGSFDELPLAMLATVDIKFFGDVDVSGVSLIAGRDFVAQDDFELELPGMNPYGLAIEAGRDILIMDDFEFEDLDMHYMNGFGPASASVVTLVR